MAIDFIFKLIIIGSPGVGKSSFVRSDSEGESCYLASTRAIGVSFQIVNIMHENFNVKLQIWDIKSSSRFIDLYPPFYKGAAACILCFDTSNQESFEQLHHWLRILRLARGNIPVYLLGTKSDLERTVQDEQINAFMNENQISLFSIMSSLTEQHMRNEVLRRIVAAVMKERELTKERLRSSSQSLSYNEKREKFRSHVMRIRNLCEPSITHEQANMDSIILQRSEMLVELDRLREIIGIGNIQDDLSDYYQVDKLSVRDRVIYYEFLKYFSTCPLCKRNNHQSYLKRFFFDDTPNNQIFKEQLFTLMEESKEFEDQYFNKILLGIPCCDCFNKVFGKT